MRALEAIHLRLALRNLRKYRLFSAINLLGLTIGLAAFLFCSLLVRYELNHDHMFAKRDRIVTVGSVFSPSSGEPISEYPNIRMAYGPLFKREIPGLQQVVRTRFERRVVTSGQGAAYLGLRFVDPGFTELFDFHYVQGSAEAMAATGSLAVTVSTARKLFGTAKALGQRLVLEHRVPLTVAAVIEDVAADSHFNSSLMPGVELTAFTAMSVLTQISDFTLAGEWSSLEPTDLTYVLLPEGGSLAALSAQVNGVAERHASTAERAYISELRVRPLRKHNTQVWDSLRFPVIESIGLLGFLVLLAAALNYINLATIQHAGRAREVGLRKTFGARPAQLVAQLLGESLALVAMAAVLATAALELALPGFNHWSAKTLRLDYGQLVPQLVALVLLVGALAGAYPALQAARFSPGQALNPGRVALVGGLRLRQWLVGAQFAIATFILAVVGVVMLQNQKVQRLSDAFPRDHLWVVDRMDAAPVVAQRREFGAAVRALPGVLAASYSGAVPFLTVGGWLSVAAPAPGAPAWDLSVGAVDAAFFATYDIPLLAGRHFPRAAARAGLEPLPVVVNEMAREFLGLVSAERAVGHIFDAAAAPGDGDAGGSVALRYRIVGVIPDQYFLGVHMPLRPLALVPAPSDYRFLSVRLAASEQQRTLAAIDTLWAQYFPGQPMHRQPLNHYFLRFFKIPSMIGRVIWLFGAVAASLALMGLFGLALYASRRRAREMALRKVMGARPWQIQLLLVRQYIAPVLVACLVALPAAYVSLDIYLRFFPERVTYVGAVVCAAGLVALLSAWAVLALQALSLARQSPAVSLSAAQ